MLARNLAALERVDRALAGRIAQATPAAVQWSASQSGPLTGTLEHQGRRLSLASRYDPMGEATKLISQVDHAKHAGIFVIGLSLGYHVQQLARSLDSNSVMVVFEPDLSLCRAVLERVDHTSWLGRPNVVLVDASIDQGTLVGRVESHSGSITQGSIIVSHPIARQTHPNEVAQFGHMITDLMAYCRTNVSTALVNAARTVRNLTANLCWYAAGSNTNDLYNAAAGMPAVCVSAGPSLAKNIDLLRDPVWRKKVVVISVQTALKPLLDRGIKPDFVTALDYHAISRRFYEGIPPLPGVTLVAEPKVHPSVIDAFPGPVRVTNNGFLERCLGPLAPQIRKIPHGATVAHLSVYLAQHLGCNPIILTGQDLAFSNGLYYCPGSAIHEVWANELSSFNTLEMMEWQRIMRHRHFLHTRPDVHGRPVYSDDQMLTYHKQFERDFADTKQTIINATEGGLPIAHTQQMTLLEALQAHASQEVPALPLPSGGLNADKLKQVLALVRQRTQEIARIRKVCEETIPLLRQILANQRQEKIVARLFNDLEVQHKRINEMEVTFGLLNELNVIGAFKRNKADRAILHDSGDEFERQRRQLERDITNLEWMIQAGEEGLVVFREAEERINAMTARAQTAG